MDTFLWFASRGAFVFWGLSFLLAYMAPGRDATENEFAALGFVTFLAFVLSGLWISGAIFRAMLRSGGRYWRGH